VINSLREIFEKPDGKPTGTGEGRERKILIDFTLFQAPYKERSSRNARKKGTGDKTAVEE